MGKHNINEKKSNLKRVIKPIIDETNMEIEPTLKE